MAARHPSPAPTYLGPPANDSGTGNRPIRRVVIHSAVIPCEPGRARQLAAMNRAGSTGGSWHYAVDPDEVIQCSYDSVVCWHAPPNQHSLGIEMADWPGRVPAARRGTEAYRSLRAAWRWSKPAQWRMLRRTARLTAQLLLAEGLPLQYLSPRDLRAGRRGWTTHDSVSRAWGQSTHWDPGWWPRRAFARMVRRHARRLNRRRR